LTTEIKRIAIAGSKGYQVEEILGHRVVNCNKKNGKNNSNIRLELLLK